MSSRQVAKRTFKNLFLILAFPIYLLFSLFSITGNEDRAFMSFSQALSLLPGKPGIYLRAAFYRLTCYNTSDQISVGFLTIFSHRDTTIGKGVYIGPQCNIGKCTIGDNTLIGSGAHILSGSRQHDFTAINEPIQTQGGSFEKIEIGVDCWVGNGAIVMASLGSKVIVAAGTVVTKAFPEGDIIAGNPARTKRNRYNE